MRAWLGCLVLALVFSLLEVATTKPGQPETIKTESKHMCRPWLVNCGKRWNA